MPSSTDILALIPFWGGSATLPQNSITAKMPLMCGVRPDEVKMKYALYIISLLHLTGCVGLTTHTGTEKSVQQFHYYQSKRDGLVKNKETAMKYWGEPLRKTKENSGIETWHYRGGLAWRGIALWVIVPVPLMAPVGNNNVEMTFSPSGELINATAEAINEKGVVCYLIYLECNPEELP